MDSCNQCLGGKYEVTNGEFRRFRGGHSSGDYSGHSLNGDRESVVWVNYEDAVAFLEWLSGRSGISEHGVQARLLTGLSGRQSRVR